MPPSRSNEPALFMLPPERVAEHLGLPASLIHRFIASGVLEAREVEPGVLRVPRAALVTLLRQHPWLQSVVQQTPRR